jgi:hypothetical protein
LVAARPAGGIVAEAYDAACGWWRGLDPALLSERPRETVLGHRDPNPANYLWDGQRVRIVDLEDAGISDSATEVAIMAEHLAWREAEPVSRSRSSTSTRTGCAARRLWAMFWLRLLLPGGPSERSNAPGTADRPGPRQSPAGREAATDGDRRPGATQHTTGYQKRMLSAVRSGVVADGRVGRWCP